MSRNKLAIALAMALGLSMMLLVLRDAPGRSASPGDGHAAVQDPGIGPGAGQARPVTSVERVDATGELVLEGQTLDRADRPVGGVTVTIDAQPSRSVVTEADGSFSFAGLLRRRYEVTASSADGVAGPVVVRLEPTTDPVVLHLVAPGRVMVTVVDAVTRAPVPGASVEVRAPVIATGLTGPGGTAALAPVAHGHWNVVASAPGHARGHGAAIVGAEPTAVTLALEHGTSLRGQIVDPRGKPIARARAFLLSTTDWTFGVSPDRDGAETGPDGRFELTGVKAGSYRLHARARGFADTVSSELGVGDAPVDAGTLVMDAAATLRGRVVYRDGKPAAGAEVKVFLPNAYPPTTHAATDGTFEIGDLPRVTVKVGAEGRGASCWSESVELASGAGTVTLTLDLEHAISGVVVDRAGNPVEGAEVAISLIQADARFVRGELTDGAGGFHIGGVPEGEYEVEATRPGIERASSERALHARTGAKVRIVLGAPGSIVGRVAFQDGAVPAVVTVRLAAGGTPRTFTDGAIRLTDVAPGTYALQIEGPEVGSATPTSAVVVDGKPTDVGTIEVQRGRTIDGLVVDADGRPVAGADVVAGAVIVGTGASVDSGTRAPAFQSELKQVASGPDGRFTLRGLAAIPLSIVASHVTAGRSPPVTLDPTATGPLRLPLAPTGSLAGTVKLGGRPLPAAVVAQPHASPLALSVVFAGSDGTFHIDRIAPGRYSIAAGAGDPLSGAPLAPVAVEIGGGAATRIDLDASRGSRALDVTTAAGGVVFVTTEPVEATTALELVTKLGLQTRGSWAMRPTQGTARFATLSPVAYTACVVAIGAREPGGPAIDAVSDLGMMLQQLALRGATIPITCRAISATATTISIR